MEIPRGHNYSIYLASEVTKINWYQPKQGKPGMETIQIIGIVFSLLGTLILAIRITKILNSISMAVKFHDLNFQIQAERAGGNWSIPNMRHYGSGKHIIEAEKFGTKLLILGFLFQIIGGICQAIVLLAHT